METNKRQCEHYAVGIVAGKPIISRLPVLVDVIGSLARLYWVGIGEPPAEDKEELLAAFQRYQYCPKCGAKIY